LVRALSGLVAATRAKHGVVFASDGLFLARSGLGQVAAEQATAFVYGLRLASDDFGTCVGKEATESVLVRYADLCVVLMPMGAQTSVALFAPASTDLKALTHSLAVFAEQHAPLAEAVHAARVRAPRIGHRRLEAVA
jgi:predicted regulator of Ras-like GTPase activity (Roadblock/LC7/MglB family)